MQLTQNNSFLPLTFSLIFLEEEFKKKILPRNKRIQLFAFYSITRKTRIKKQLHYFFVYVNNLR